MDHCLHGFPRAVRTPVVGQALAIVLAAIISIGHADPKTIKSALFYASSGACLGEIGCNGAGVSTTWQRVAECNGISGYRTPDGEFMELLDKLIANIGQCIVGKDQEIRQVVAALLARGHILIEDVPGVGKTMLARSLARSIDARFCRIQFTPDLLPSDITGVSVFNQKEQTFEFRAGPVFTQILLADELNRATPRTQSALLECMGERQVTVDGATRPMDSLFFVIATQNPIEQHGVYNLPEAQLDRFLMKIEIGYPALDEEMTIVTAQEQVHPIERLQAVVSVTDLLRAQEAIKRVYVDASITEYITRLVAATRRHELLLLGASPRASLAFFRLAQAWSAIQGRDFVDPDTIKLLARPIFRHRIILTPQARLAGTTPDQIVAQVLERVPVPVKPYGH